MTVYTVAGHPLGNITGVDPLSAEALRVALLEKGVGATITITLSGPDDTKVKGHGALK